MIAVAPFQLRSGKPLAGKRASECATGLLSLCAKRRHGCEQKHCDQLVHPTVLEQRPSRRPVPLAALHYGFSPMTQGVRSASALAFGRVLFSSEEVQRHVRLITNDPAVVRHWRNVKQIACVKFNYATIIERNGRRS